MFVSLRSEDLRSVFRRATGVTIRVLSVRLTVLCDVGGVLRLD